MPNVADYRSRNPGRVSTFHSGMARSSEPPPITPDGRYIVVRGRLWRRSNPHLSEAVRQRLVDTLMNARRAVAAAKRTADERAEAAAHAAVDRAKHDLGERGPVWWDDGAADYNRHLAKNTPYADWFEDIDHGAKTASGQGR